jgi:hypothetical protein
MYDKNVPYGKCYTYENDELVATDLYTNGVLVSEIESEAVLLTSDVIKNLDYADQYVYVEGKVSFVAQDDDVCYFRVDTESAGMITGSYTNTNGNKSAQMVIPNMTVGSEIRLYGFYIGVAKNKVIADGLGYGYDYICLNPVFGELVEEPLEEWNVPDYDTLVEYPYINTMENFESDMVVEQVVRSGKKYYIVASKKNKKENTAEQYVLFYKGSWSDVFVTGSEIHVTGYYDGQYHILTGTENDRYAQYLQEQKDNNSSNDITTFLYDSYPMIHVEEIQ